MRKSWLKKRLKQRQSTLTDSRTPRQLERIKSLQKDLIVYKATMIHVMGLAKEKKWQEAYALHLWRYTDARLGRHLWFLIFDLDHLAEFSDAPQIEKANLEALEAFVGVRARWAYKRALEDLVECALAIQAYEVRKW